MVVLPPLWADTAGSSPWSDSGLEGGGRTVGPSPPVVREGLVRLGHLVDVLAALDCGAQTVARIQQLVHEALDHGLLTTLLGEGHQPAEAERGLADRTHLDG